MPLPAEKGLKHQYLYGAKVVILDLIPLPAEKGLKPMWLFASISHCW